jgi:hypothetical protein
MFIACGVLYGIESATDVNTKIDFALDLYKLKLLDVSLNFGNPIGKTTTVGYNHRNKEIYSVNKGSQLAFPVRFQHEVNLNVQHVAGYETKYPGRDNSN